MNESIEIVAVEERELWNEVLRRADGFDFYHTPEYHELAEAAGEGKGILFVVSDSSHLAAWPFLLRPLHAVGGLEHLKGDVFDATSVYGYCGPVFNASARREPVFIRRFGSLLHGTAKELHLVSLFSRMHPLLENASRDLGVGRFVPMGETVSIDLLQSSNTQWLDMRKGHRYDIRKAQARGVNVFHDHNLVMFDQFVSLYENTMKRVSAAPYYFFSPQYFQLMRHDLGDRLHLFVAELDGIIHSACLFVRTGFIIQYYLSASSVEGRRTAATKLILNEARLWGRSTGARVLHLGGGVGGNSDNLLAFKEGFSRLRHTFHVWHAIPNAPLYQSLVHARREWLRTVNSQLPNTDFFPLYRAEGLQESVALRYQSSTAFRS